MRFPSSILSLLTLALLGCGEDKAPDQVETLPHPSNPESTHQGQGLPGFFSPQVGESWTYNVQRDLPPGTVLNDDDQLRSTDIPGGGYRFTHERKRVCLGTQTPPDSNQELTVLELSEDGIPSGEEYLDIGPEGMIARGWKPAGKPGIKLQLLTPGVLLASPQMSGGQVWQSNGTSPKQVFQFRVLERTELTVPAGTYEAARLQMNTGTEEQGIRRTLWFAENVGIIREEVIYFNNSQITLRESAELTSWTVPQPDEPKPPAPEEEESVEEESPTDPDPIIDDINEEEMEETLPTETPDEDNPEEPTEDENTDTPTEEDSNDSDNQDSPAPDEETTTDAETEREEDSGESDDNS